MTRSAADRFGQPGNSRADWQASRPLQRVPWVALEQLAPTGCRVVVVAPHPDDEVLACGGLLAMLAERGGVDILIVSVTDGDASHPGSTRWPRQRLVAERLRESTEALRRLGLGAGLEWLRLGMPDSRVPNHETVLVERLAVVLRPRDQVFTTWRHDGHCDHEAVGRATAEAAAAAGACLHEVPVWAWHWAQPHGMDLPWPRARRLALGPAQLERKRAAIAAHVSQLQADPSTGAAPVLSAQILEHLTQPFELVFL